MSRMLPIGHCHECPHHDWAINDENVVQRKCELTGEWIAENELPIPESCTLPKEFEEEL